MSRPDGFLVDAVCIGETMLLLVPDPPQPPERAETFRRDIGGAESNVAIHLSRLGRQVVWHSALGDDAFGRYVRSRVAAEGVDCSEVRFEPDHPTGLYVKEFGEAGTTVVYYRRGSAACTLGPADLHAVWARRPRLVHTTGITAAISEPGHALVAGLLDDAPAGVLRSFDVNYRPRLHAHGGSDTLRDLAGRADIVFCGVDEANALWGASTVDEVWRLLGPDGTLVVKQGSDGATVFQAGRRWHLPAPQVDVVEPVGAGDAFAAGVLHGVLDSAGWPECLARGNRLAAEVLQVHGDLPPDEARATHVG
ncbi:MAG: sugar kinase [Nocardioidaceae bacterium]